MEMMDANLWIAAKAGVTATVVMTLLIYLFKLGNINIDIPYLLGSRFNDPSNTGGVYTVGLFLHFLIGAFWGILYIFLMTGMALEPNWSWGMLWGFAHGIFMGVIMGTMARNHPHIGKDKALSDPGMFGNRWGPYVPYILLLIHVVYGLLVGYMYDYMFHLIEIPRL